jgi:hypothetical protein
VPGSRQLVQDSQVQFPAKLTTWGSRRLNFLKVQGDEHAKTRFRGVSIEAGSPRRRAAKSRKISLGSDAVDIAEA